MSHRTWPGKHFFLLVALLVAVLSCQKQDDTPPQNTEVPPSTAAFESLFTFPAKTFCGTAFTSDLRAKNGVVIGSVEVNNDDLYLYLTYNLKDNWYLVNVQTYTGPKALLPADKDGNPEPERFPGKQALAPCDLKQSFTFRVALASLTSESDAGCAGKFFTAMRAVVRHIPNAATCASEIDEEAWAAPIVINPGKNKDWATAFYYCKQDCPPPPPPVPAWCSYSQGYWFASNGHDWGTTGEVVYGDLHVSKADGLKIWDKKNRTVLQKAFFQASALQLSRDLVNDKRPIPDEIKGDYDLIAGVLATIDGATLNSGTPTSYPNGIKEEDVQAAAGRIGKWICTHHCNSTDDPTACNP